MAALTTAQEYQAIREAIQALSTGERSVQSFTADGLTVTYSQDDLEDLQEREKLLAERLTIRNSRKRTQPDFTG